MGQTQDHNAAGASSRRVVVALLVVAGCVLTPVAATAVWLRNQVTDSDRYVRTISPLADDPAIRAAVASEITAALFTRVDVAAEAERALPDRAKILAVPIASGVRDFAEDATLRLLSSERFQELWIDVNRVSHEQLVRVLTGGGDLIRTSEGTVVLDLAPVLEAVKAELAARGVTIFDRVPAESVSTSFVLMESEELERAQRGFRLLEALAFVLPVLVFASLGGAVALSTRRRRTVLRAALGVAASVVVLGGLLMLARTVYVAEVEDAGLSEDAATAFYDIVVHWLRIGIRAIFALALLVAAGAFLAGPSRAAEGVRRRFRSAVDWSAGGTAIRSSASARWVAENKRGLRIAAVAAPAVAFVFWTAPTPAVLVVLVGLALLALLAIELVAAPPGPSGGAPVTHA